LVLSVTVTIYFPGAEALTELCPAGKPVHVIVALGLVVVAVKFTASFAHVSVSTGAMDIIIGIIPLIILIESCFVHPLVLLVAVTMYLPGADTVIGFRLTGNPAHVKVVLGVADEAVRVTKGFELEITVSSAEMKSVGFV
jgi:hypothetical protein